MSDGQSRFRLAAQTAFACAKLHVVALVAMALVLRQGLPPAPPDDRLRFIQEHRTAWTCSWMLWILTTVALGLFYFCIHRALGTGRRGWIAIGLAVAGMGADLVGDRFYMSVYPDVYDPRSFAELDRMTAMLSGGLANGAYTIAWLLLLWRAPFPRWLLVFAAPGVAGGIGLAASGFLNWTPGLVAGTAVAIPCFTLWSAAAGRFFWKNAAGTATMSPHV